MTIGARVSAAALVATITLSLTSCSPNTSSTTPTAATTIAQATNRHVDQRFPRWSHRE